MKYILSYLQAVLIITILLYLPGVFAAQDLGHVAKNMMEPVSVVTGFVLTACYVLGGSFLFTSVIKYFEYRRNPLAVPFGTVAFLFIIGALLILLPLLTTIYREW